MTVLSGIVPNQEYTVSVSAYGSSCVSNPATVNFTSPARVSSPPGTDSKLCSISVVGTCVWWVVMLDLTKM